MSDKGKSTSNALNIRLSDAQEEKFQVLADADHTSRSETIRRIIDDAYERHLEGLSESKLDAIFRGVQGLIGDLTTIRAQGEALRSMESIVRTETAALRAAVNDGSKDSRLLLAKIYFDVRSIFEGHPKHEELLALRDRLMREA